MKGDAWADKKDLQLQLRIFQDLFNGRVAIEYASDTVLAQGDHAARARPFLQDQGRFAFVDEKPDLVVDGEILIDATSSLVAGIVAILTTFPVVEGLTADHLS